MKHERLWSAYILLNMYQAHERLWSVWANGGTEYVSGTWKVVVCRLLMLWGIGREGKQVDMNKIYETLLSVWTNDGTKYVSGTWKIMVCRVLTHWDRGTYICLSELCHHCFRYWLVAWLAPSHYLKQYLGIVNWTLGKILQWNFNRNSYSMC